MIYNILIYISIIVVQVLQTFSPVGVFNQVIDPALLNAAPATAGSAGTFRKAQPHFQMRPDPDGRMAGSIPVWNNPAKAPPPEEIPEETSASFETALNYAGQEDAPIGGSPDEESFGFGDLVDIVNPLHHIPLVSTLYESVSGDTIKPSGRIIGGALFGGFAGAASGIANVIIEEETGKDVAGNVASLINKGELSKSTPAKSDPEDMLNEAATIAFNNGITPDTNIPASAHALQASPTASSKTFDHYEQYVFDDDRMAGTMMRKKNSNDQMIAAPAPLSPLPPAKLAPSALTVLAASRRQYNE